MPEWDSPDALRWAVLILDTYRRRTGEDLVARGDDPRDDARRLHLADRVVLCHDGRPDPCFVYANAAACALWGIPRDELVGMPSRLSAGPQARADRAAALQRALADGLLRGYSGVRRARDGSLFEIHDATVWTVDDAGAPVGQAATFRRWTPLPPP